MSGQSEFRYDFDGVGDLPADVDEAAVRRMDLVAFVLDDGLAVPGTDRRIGVDPIVGLLPVAGDSVTAIASLYIVVQAALLGVDRSTLARMVFNVAVDLAGGSVPLAGDLFDAAWKANRRNVELAVEDLSTGAEPITVESPEAEPY